MFNKRTNKKTNRKRNFLQTKYQLVNKQTNRIWNFLQTGFQLFNMLIAAHNSEERSSSFTLTKQTGKGTFSKPNINLSTNKQTGYGTFSKLVFSCSTCSMPHTILRRGRLHLP